LKSQAILELEDQKDLDLENAATWLSERRLESFAIFLIEAHLPLTSLLSTICLVGTPLLIPFIDNSRISQFQGLLEDREKLEELTVLLEKSLKTRAGGN